MPNAITRSLQLAAVRKDAAALTAVEAGSGQRVYTFKASDGDFDRYSDRLSVKGWRVEGYNANGVVLFNHDDGAQAASTGAEPALPIGKGRVYVEGDALMIDIVFDDEDDFARKVERKVAKGILNAVSVRYLMLPGQYRQNERGGLAVPVLVAEWRGPCAACAPITAPGGIIQLSGGTPAGESSSIFHDTRDLCIASPQSSCGQCAFRCTTGMAGTASRAAISVP